MRAITKVILSILVLAIFIFSISCTKGDKPTLEKIEENTVFGEKVKEEKIETDILSERNEDAGSKEGLIREEGGLPDDISPPEKLYKKAFLIIESGNDQRGEVNKPLLHPIVVRYIGPDGKWIEGRELSFSVIRGGGKFSNGKKVLTVKTDSKGRAAAVWILGEEEGFQAQVVEVSVVGSSELPLTFRASAFIPGPPERTAFSGIVVDNAGDPIEGVSVYIFKNNKKSPTVRTDSSGSFLLTGLKDFVGKAHLVVDGTTALPKQSYPRLEYEVYNISGITNRLDGPASLPKLEPSGSFRVFVDKTIEVKPPKIPGLKMVIAAGSATFPNKKKSGTVNITKVDPYWIPMPLPNGYASSIVVTTQPPDVRFWPPAPITFPNVDKAKPGTILPIFSFDHTKGRYVKVADGKVTADGKYIRSLPGQGIVKGGWHAPARLNPLLTTLVSGKIDGYPDRKGRPGPFQGYGTTVRRADPVLLHNGEFRYQVTDFFVQGRGMHFLWVRTYSNRFQYNGPLGYNWDHNYNMRLEILSNGDVVFRNGAGRADTFKWDSKSRQFISPPGVYSTLTRLASKNFVLRNPGGMKYLFDSHGYLLKIEDRFGNAISFEYNFKGQLIAIIDSVGRVYSLSYYPHGRIKSIRDFTGRTVIYKYDENFNLISVTTPGTDQFPKGITVKYKYSSGYSDPLLNHNLTHIYNPDGSLYLKNTYDNDDRVVEQKVGRGTYLFSYRRVNSPGDKKDPNTIVSITEFTDPENNREIHYFNSQGNPVKIEKISKGGGSGSSKAWVVKTVYNRDGQPVKKVFPNGNFIEYLYDSKNPDRRAHGNVIQVKRVTHLSGDKYKELVTKYTYESRYQLLKKVVGPRGTCPGCNSKLYTTVYYYDFEEKQLGDLNGDGSVSGSAGLLVKEELPPVVLPDGKLKSRVLTYTYNKYGQIKSATNPNGSVTLYEYYGSNGIPGDPSDREGLLKRIILDARGMKIETSFEYDLLGRITAVTDHEGNTTRYIYNARGQKLLEIGPAPFFYKTIFVYNINDQLVEIKRENRDEKGRLIPEHPYITTRFKYTITGRIEEVAREKEPGRFVVWRNSYDKLYRIVKKTLPTGESECFQYDERGLIVTITEGCGSPTPLTYRYKYDDNGNLTELTTPSGARYRYRYDGYDRRISATLPTGAVVRFEYDRAGNIVKIERYGTFKGKSGQLLSRKELFYDGNSFIYKEKNSIFAQPGGQITDQITLFFRDTYGNIVRYVDPKGNTSYFTYDSLGRMVKYRDPLNNEELFRYNFRSQLLNRTLYSNISGARKVISEFSNRYDSLGRLIEQRDALGRTISFKYDSRHNLRQLIDAVGDSIYFGYNALNHNIYQVIELRYGKSTVSKERWSYRRDDNGRLLSLTGPNGFQALYKYDHLGRKIEERYTSANSKNPLQLVNKYSYNAKGQLVSYTSSNGVVQRYTYDGANRIVRVDISKPSQMGGVSFISYKYDDLSRVVEIKDNFHTVSKNYDSLGRVTSEKLDGYTVFYKYDLNGNVVSIRYPQGRELLYSYDALNRIVDIRWSNSSASLAKYRYLGRSLRAESTLGNGTQLKLDFDRAEQIVRYRWLSKGGKLFYGAQFKYDKRGLLLFTRYLHGSKLSDVYGYDSFGRLRSVAYGVKDPTKELQNPGSQSASRRVFYDLDPLDNRVSVRDGSVVTPYSSNSLNQYVKVGNNFLKYDAAGNLIDDGNRLFSYDFAGRLLSVRDKKSKKLLASFQYDPLGRLTLYNSGSQSVKFVYAGLHVIEERDSKGKLLATYSYSGAIDERITMERGGATYYYHLSYLGSTIALTDSSGKVVERYRYDVFGTPTVFDSTGKAIPSSAVGNPYLFTGRRYLYDLKLYYYRARFYNPAWGRFIQPDPKGIVDGLNLYTYAGCNPVSFSDPLGLEKEDECEKLLKHAKLTNTPLYAIDISANFGYLLGIPKVGYGFGKAAEYGLFFGVDYDGNIFIGTRYSKESSKGITDSASVSATAELILSELHFPKNYTGDRSYLVWGGKSKTEEVTGDLDLYNVGNLSSSLGITIQKSFLLDEKGNPNGLFVNSYGANVSISLDYDIRALWRKIIPVRALRNISSILRSSSLDSAKVFKVGKSKLLACLFYLTHLIYSKFKKASVPPGPPTWLISMGLASNILLGNLALKSARKGISFISNVVKTGFRVLKKKATSLVNWIGSKIESVFSSRAPSYSPAPIFYDRNNSASIYGGGVGTSHPYGYSAWDFK